MLIAAGQYLYPFYIYYTTSKFYRLFSFVKTPPRTRRGQVLVKIYFVRIADIIRYGKIKKGEGSYVLYPEKSVQKHHAHTFLQQFVKPRSRLATDGSSLYRNIEQWWPIKHTKDIHAKWEFSKTSEIEGLFGNPRTFIRRMYIMSPQKRCQNTWGNPALDFPQKCFKIPTITYQKCLITESIDQRNHISLDK